MPTLNFLLNSHHPVSKAFLDRSITTFQEAADYMQRLPYGRNTDKVNLGSVFTDGCGTCSTKHALLKQLADENGLEGLQLIMGMIRMHAGNFPVVAHTLQTHNLTYLPEAHCYLKWQGHTLDFTKANSDPADFLPDLLEETEIQPHQITDFKVAYHRDFMQRWLTDNPDIPYSLEELWEIREQCIKDLGSLL